MRIQAHRVSHGQRNSPSGPFTVMVRFTMFLYEVVDFAVLRSLIESSTPGGRLMGVRPSFELSFAVAENHGRWAFVIVCCRMETRHAGIAAAEGLRNTCLSICALLSTQFEAIDTCEPAVAKGCSCSRRWHPSSKVGLCYRQPI